MRPFLPPFTHCLLCRACMQLWEAQAFDMLLPTLAASATEDEAMLPANSTADYKALTPPAFISKHTMAVAMQQREVGIYKQSKKVFRYRGKHNQSLLLTSHICIAEHHDRAHGSLRRSGASQSGEASCSAFPQLRPDWEELLCVQFLLADGCYVCHGSPGMHVTELESQSIRYRTLHAKASLILCLRSRRLASRSSHACL